MQGLSTRQSQGHNFLVTCIENFSATTELPNKAFENHDTMGKITFPDMNKRTNAD